MNEVFLDTVGILAVWDESDQWHAAADRSYQRLLAEGRRLITTTAVLYECGNAAARRHYRPRVGALRQLFAQEQLLIDPIPEGIEGAWAAYNRGQPGDAGIVDHISFAVMRRLQISEAFTNDQHFRSAGFILLF